MSKRGYYQYYVEGEDELIRSCDIKQIKELLGSKSNKDYKHDLIIEKNLKNKLLAHSFNMDEFWAKTPKITLKILTIRQQA